MHTGDRYQHDKRGNDRCEKDEREGDARGGAALHAHAAEAGQDHCFHRGALVQGIGLAHRCGHPCVVSHDVAMISTVHAWLCQQWL